MHTKYDHYSSLISPIEKYLVNHGFSFFSNATVTDMEIKVEGNDKTVTALHICEGSKADCSCYGKKLMFFTNDSIVQNSTQESMFEALCINRDTVHKGCSSLWEKLTTKCPKYGHSEKFAFDPGKSSFVSCSVTVHDYPHFLDYLAKKSAFSPARTDTPPLWMHYVVYRRCNILIQPFIHDQPENAQFMWFYGLRANNCGTYTKKAIIHCSGEKIMHEFLYYYGLEDRIDKIIAPYTAIPVIIPLAVYYQSVHAPQAER